jgi:hypothetical protein
LKDADVRRCIAIFLWVALVLVILDTGISLFLTCKEASDQSGAYQDAKEQCGVFNGPLSFVFLKFVHFFETHDKGIVAAFTVVLASSTILLWLSTRGLLQATQAQAKITEEAFVKLERPYVYVFDVNRFEIAASGIGCVRYKVANYGKTPATIELVENNVSFHNEGPLDPIVADYRDDPEHPLLKRPILGFNFEEQVRVYAPGNLSFVTGTRGEVVPKPPDSTDAIFVWVRISDRGPFTAGHQTSACWRYDGLTNRLVQWGGEKYNYTR